MCENSRSGDCLRRGGRQALVGRLFEVALGPPRSTPTQTSIATFPLIDSGTAGRGEMKVQAAALLGLEPTLRGSAVVPAVVAQDQMWPPVRRHFLLPVREELHQLLATMLRQATAPDFPVPSIAGGKQAGRSLPLAVVGASCRRSSASVGGSDPAQILAASAAGARPRCRRGCRRYASRERGDETVRFAGQSNRVLGVSHGTSATDRGWRQSNSAAPKTGRKQINIFRRGETDPFRGSWKHPALKT